MTRSVGVIIVVQRTETALVAVMERSISSTLLLGKRGLVDKAAELGTQRSSVRDLPRSTLCIPRKDT